MLLIYLPCSSRPGRDAGGKHPGPHAGSGQACVLWLRRAGLVFVGVFVLSREVRPGRARGMGCSFSPFVFGALAHSCAQDDGLGGRAPAFGTSGVRTCAFKRTCARSGYSISPPYACRNYSQ